jgi:hypothetical protein
LVKQTGHCNGDSPWDVFIDAVNVIAESIQNSAQWSPIEKGHWTTEKGTDKLVMECCASMISTNCVNGVSEINFLIISSDFALKIC